MDRVGRSDRVRLAFQLLDETRGAAPLPDADQPQGSDAGLAQRREFGSRDLIQAAYAPAVTPTQLVQPDEAVAGGDDRSPHPLRLRSCTADRCQGDQFAAFFRRAP